MASNDVAMNWQLVIGDANVDALSGEELEVVNPGNGQVIGTVPRGRAEDVDRAVQAAMEAHEDGRWIRMSPRGRERILWRLAELLEENSEHLGATEALNQGRRAAQETLGIRYAAAVRYNAGWIERMDGKANVLQRGDDVIQAYTRKEPIGVAGLILPWNGPLGTAVEKVSAALCAGCTCVVKPAEETPFTAIRLGQLCLEAGIPPGVVNVVTGLGTEAGAALARHEDVPKISFTGSTEVGRLLIKASGETNMKKLTLELGGKSPMIIFEDADVAKSVAAVSHGVYNLLSGQTCSAPTRLFVHESLFEQVVGGICEYARRMRVGYFADADMGPIISKRQLERVQDYVDSGLADGAEAVVGGHAISGDGFFFEPTLMINVDQRMKMVREEIFGPVICALSFVEESAVVKAANDTSYGLAGSVWTKDISRGVRVGSQIRAGRVGINNYPARELSMPAGGVRQSGWGRECGPDGIDEFLETKSVYIA